MPTRTSFSQVSTPGFVGDPGSVRRVPGGRQIDWATVPAAYVDATTGNKVIRAGTPMVEIDATGLMVPRGVGAATAGRTAIGLLTSDAHEGLGVGRSEAMSGYGVISGAVVYENLLPELPAGGSVLDATVRTELADLAGGGIAFELYSDDRGS